MMLRSPFNHTYTDADGNTVSMSIEHDGIMSDLMTKIVDLDQNIKSSADFTALTGVDLWKFPFEVIDLYIEKVSSFNPSDTETLGDLEEEMNARFYGKFSGLAEFAEAHYRANHESVPEGLGDQIDWEDYGREHLRSEYLIAKSADHDGVYVFAA